MPSKHFCLTQGSKSYKNTTVMIVMQVHTVLRLRRAVIHALFWGVNNREFDLEKPNGSTTEGCSKHPARMVAP
jgi:hypothetical protein